MAPLGSGVVVMIQGFNWESAHGQDAYWYRFLKDKIDHLRWLGVGAIWLPPPSDSVGAEGVTYAPEVFVPFSCHICTSMHHELALHMTAIAPLLVSTAIFLSVAAADSYFA